MSSLVWLGKPVSGREFCRKLLQANMLPTYLEFTSAGAVVHCHPAAECLKYAWKRANVAWKARRGDL